MAARIDRQAARHSERDVPHPKAVVGDRQPAEHDLVARHRALGRRVRQRAVDARVGDRVRVHDACDLALLVLAAARERHEDLARVGELADGRAVHGARVDERADEGDAVGERAEGQEVGHAGFEGGHGGGGVGDGDAEAGVEGRDFVEGVVWQRCVSDGATGRLGMGNEEGAYGNRRGCSQRYLACGCRSLAL